MSTMIFWTEPVHYHILKEGTVVECVMDQGVVVGQEKKLRSVALIETDQQAEVGHEVVVDRETCLRKTVLTETDR